MELQRLSVIDRGEYRKELERVKQSKKYRMLQSVSNPGKGISKTFSYHYAEEEEWKLGSGAYGEVYCCYFEEVVTGRVHKFALKVIQVPSGMTEVKKIEDTVATTRQEIRSLVRLRQNPNIIKVEDVIGGDRFRIFLILEYCNNKDLQSFFNRERQQGRLRSEGEILFYFKQLLNGFQDLYKYKNLDVIDDPSRFVIHNQGTATPIQVLFLQLRHNIIHRDIKPANIFVHNNTIKIGDFGLSQQLFQKKQNLHDHRTIGTLSTSSPQLIFKDNYTSKCDIYSLGVTLYWMFYQKFPFSHLDAFDKEQLLKCSLNFDQDAPLRPSQELAHLLRQMLAYREDDRIGWQDLFSHALFKNIALPQPAHQVRESIGRNLGQNVSILMESIIPADFYLYVGEQADLEAGDLLEVTEKGTVQPFLKVFREGKNFKFRLHFLKMLLREVWEVGHREKIKHKVEFAIVRDLLRLGLDSYILHLYRGFLDQLNGLHTLRLLDLNILNELSCSKCFLEYLDIFTIEVETYQNSQDKQKLSEEQRRKLEVNCREYDIADKFHLILGGELLMKDEAEFLEQVKRCIVQLIYFVKEEVRYYAHRENNLPKEDELRYRKLVLLIHHFNIFILQNKIFPAHYLPELKYDHDEFERHELYENKLAFLQLASQINDIISRFQN